MTRTAQSGRREKRLDRIVVILLALALLAERAAGAPLPIRFLVLWAFRRADAAARDYIADARDLPPNRPPLAPMSRDGCSPADALAVAWSLRMLALTVGAMVAQLRRQAFLQQRARRIPAPCLPARRARSAAPERRLDTS